LNILDLNIVFLAVINRELDQLKGELISLIRLDKGIKINFIDLRTNYISQLHEKMKMNFYH